MADPKPSTAERARTADGKTLTAEQHAAYTALLDRLRWPSLHWGVESVHPEAWPHLAIAAADTAIAAAAAKALAPLDEILALHRPWYDVDGAHHDCRVCVPWDEAPDDHVCRVGGIFDSCEPGDYHQVLACVECRSVTEEGEPGNLLWPCPTAAITQAARSALLPTFEVSPGAFMEVATDG